MRIKGDFTGISKKEKDQINIILSDYRRCAKKFADGFWKCIFDESSIKSSFGDYITYECRKTGNSLFKNKKDACEYVCEDIAYFTKVENHNAVNKYRHILEELKEKPFDVSSIPAIIPNDNIICVRFNDGCYYNGLAVLDFAVIPFRMAYKVNDIKYNVEYHPCKIKIYDNHLEFLLDLKSKQINK